MSLSFTLPLFILSALCRTHRARILISNGAKHKHTPACSAVSISQRTTAGFGCLGFAVTPDTARDFYMQIDTWGTHTVCNNVHRCGWNGEREVRCAQSCHDYAYLQGAEILWRWLCLFSEGVSQNMRVFVIRIEMMPIAAAMHHSACESPTSSRPPPLHALCPWIPHAT